MIVNFQRLRQIESNLVMFSLPQIRSRQSVEDHEGSLAGQAQQLGNAAMDGVIRKQLTQ